jgi:hypothetical protein
VGVLDPATMTWSIYTYADGMRAGDGVAGFDVDAATGHVWTAHHPVLGYITLPNGQQQRYFDGGGASRWNGSTWQSWTKPSATIRAFGDKGITEAVMVDRRGGLAWLGGWDGDPVTYHWGLGRDVDAALNWCPLDGCTDGAWSAKVWPDDGTVAALAQDATGRVWVGTNRSEAGLTPAKAGVKLLADGAWYAVDTTNSDLVSGEVSSLASDGDRMWVGSLSRGASLYLPEPPPTATPEASATPTASSTPTASTTVEVTPTVPRTSTVTPTATTGEATVTPSATPSLPCGPGGRCAVWLPYTSRR